MKKKLIKYETLFLTLIFLGSQSAFSLDYCLQEKNVLTIDESFKVYNLKNVL